MPTNNPVLLVEDDELVARAVSRVLQARGFEVTGASDCDAARGLEHGFSVGVFDLDLPDGNGVSLAVELLSRGQVQQAVFFTANSDPLLQARARQVGPVVRKTQGVSALLEVLSKPPALKRVVGDGLASDGWATDSDTPVPESRTHRR